MLCMSYQSSVDSRMLTVSCKQNIYTGQVVRRGGKEEFASKLAIVGAVC